LWRCDVVTKNVTYSVTIGRMIEPIVATAFAVRSNPDEFVNNGRHSVREEIAL